MKKFIGRALLIISVMLFLILIGSSIWSIYQRKRDPMPALDRGIVLPEVVIQKDYPVESEMEFRRYSDMVLFSEEIDSIRLTVSMPDTVPREGLPVIIVLGGLEIGRKSLSYIPTQRQNILISYQYPYSPRYWYDGTKLFQIPQIRRAALLVPAQVEALARWAEQQPWSGRKRISILGYSFGAFFVPAVYHLAEVHELPLGPAVMAYGGVNIYRLLLKSMKNLSYIPRHFIAWFAATAIYPLEPALHVSYLKQDCLLINGRNDHQIPDNSWKTLHELVPKPKTVIILDAGHMHPGKLELTLKVVDLSRQWLAERNAINP
jgi:pimeloyl-ACP methyl ester carboxylesterase